MVIEALIIALILGVAIVAAAKILTNGVMYSVEQCEHILYVGLLLERQRIVLEMDYNELDIPEWLQFIPGIDFEDEDEAEAAIATVLHLTKKPLQKD